MADITNEQAWQWLEDIKDPEIPSVSIVDMGMVLDVETKSTGETVIYMVPTFVGCPALEMIKRQIITYFTSKEVQKVEVFFSFSIPWSSAHITERGRENLKKHGIAPPPRDFKLGDPWTVQCPYCQSSKTVIDNVFGPTACRSILYCSSCKNPFEAIKPI
ncbi:1,2-phenylacetyl-CoA epoxidase subunit PaaD [Bacillus horti]|uniref:Ring-1,2-phenylacetyl-CoA epoxidase subunit PaaD n=1 Tax=Caldalkalibacillus horti TaxID=77523 RepID=A0ABT9W0W4_9BACI|nr:1,2-phenylacetyl-CoA epoxidase subunit PaaD [Bacillus horti]MDQ0166697.1 ring-1,2-phenylacetyl-CoA epoxidase subunit PaaD [Bacillus horti]